MAGIAVLDRFTVALVLVALAALGAGAIAAVAPDEDGLAPRELLRLEPLPTEADAADPGGELDGHLRWTFELLSGEGTRMSDADLRDRFDPWFSSGRSADELNAVLDMVEDRYGPVSFVRYELRDEREVEAVAVSASGTGLIATLVLADDGRLQVWGIDELPTRARVQPWEIALSALVGWLCLAAAHLTRRLGARRVPWVLLVASVPYFAVALVASDVVALYALGRALPATGIVAMVVLLLPRPASSMAARIALATAVGAAVAGVLAPFTRDAAALANPSIGGLADDASLHRGLLTAAACLAALAMAATARDGWRRGEVRSRWAEPLRRAVTSVATVWAAAAMVAALDSALGDGDLATVEMWAVTTVCAATVPVLVGLRQLGATVDHPQLADLVIELDSDDGNLRQAVARALGDPTAVVLEADRDGRLSPESPRSSASGGPSTARARTTITRSGTVLGALETDATRPQLPEQLRATAAAVGMELDLTRLNQEVHEQLREVEASRARIVQASDAARHQVERDLHDGAQQRLVALGITLQRARRQAEAAGIAELIATVDRAADEVRATLDDLRAVSRGAPPALLAERGLAAAVDALAELAPVPVTTEVSATSLDPDTQLTAYYLIAEGLTNVAKHAHATRAHVSVAPRPGHVLVQVRDDGSGGATTSTGSGLEGLHDRVQAVGGTFSVCSSTDGTELRATLPRVET